MSVLQTKSFHTACVTHGPRRLSSNRVLLINYRYGNDKERPLRVYLAPTV